MQDRSLKPGTVLVMKIINGADTELCIDVLGDSVGHDFPVIQIDDAVEVAEAGDGRQIGYILNQDPHRLAGMEVPVQKVPGRIVPHLPAPYVYFLAEPAPALSRLQILLLHDPLDAVPADRLACFKREYSGHRTIAQGVISAFLYLLYPRCYLPVADGLG